MLPTAILYFTEYNHVWDWFQGLVEQGDKPQPNDKRPAEHYIACGSLFWKHGQWEKEMKDYLKTGISAV